MGISKGMWKKELKAQVTGEYDKWQRYGKRKPKEEGGADSSKHKNQPLAKPMLGKREYMNRIHEKKKSARTATDHKKGNTSTFKSQKKK